MTDPRPGPFAGLGFVTFDFEGRWGMPFDAAYELERATEQILVRLAAHGARGTFFVVGELAERHPELLRRIAAGGHELALHGYRHEAMTAPGSLPPVALAAGIERAGYAIADAAGRPPRGFRAPYLMAPEFFDAEIYRRLAEGGYVWASNWELRHPIELVRPDRLRARRPWHGLAAQPGVLDGRIAVWVDRALNAAARRRPGAPPPPSRRTPFRRGGLLEIPVYAPLDVDLLGLPRPTEVTDPDLLAYAGFALERCAGEAALPALFTFHDWVVAGAGRITLLDRALAALERAGRPSVTISERLEVLEPVA